MRDNGRPISSRLVPHILAKGSEKGVRTTLISALGIKSQRRTRFSYAKLNLFHIRSDIYITFLADHLSYLIFPHPLSFSEAEINESEDVKTSTSSIRHTDICIVQ